LVLELKRPEGSLRQSLLLFGPGSKKGKKRGRTNESHLSLKRKERVGENDEIKTFDTRRTKEEYSKLWSSYVSEEKKVGITQHARHELLPLPERRIDRAHKGAKVGGEKLWTAEQTGLQYLLTGRKGDLERGKKHNGSSIGEKRVTQGVKKGQTRVSSVSNQKMSFIVGSEKEGDL